MTFWENVEYVREYRDMTRKELAYKADFSINSISTGITRGSFPAVDVACRIAKVLGVSVEFLVNGDAMKDKLPKNSKDIKNDDAIKDELEKKFQNLLKYSCVIDDFAQIASEVQKPIEELIHKLAVS